MVREIILLALAATTGAAAGQDNPPAPPTLLSPDLTHAVSFSPDGKTFVSSGAFSTVRVWTVDARTVAREFKLGYGIVVSRFSPDGRALACAASNSRNTGDNGLFWCDIAGGQKTRIAPGGPTTLSFSPDGTLLAVASWSAAVDIRRAPDGGLVTTLATPAKLVLSVAFSPDGSRLALGCGRNISVQDPWDPAQGIGLSLWDTKTWKEVRNWACPDAGLGIRCVAWAPDGKTIATGGMKGATLWDPETGRALKALPADPVDGVAFDGDGRRVVGGTEAAVVVWDAASGRELARLPGGGGPARHYVYGFITVVAVSPDGKRVASGGEKGLHLLELPR